MRILFAVHMATATLMMAFCVGVSMWCNVACEARPQPHQDSDYPVCRHCVHKSLSAIDDPSSFIAVTQLASQIAYFVCIANFAALILLSAFESIFRIAEFGLSGFHNAVAFRAKKQSSILTPTTKAQS